MFAQANFKHSNRAGGRMNGPTDPLNYQTSAKTKKENMLNPLQKLDTIDPEPVLIKTWYKYLS